MESSTDTPDLKLLFDQLGLDSEGHAIDDFIDAHQLPDDIKISEASFWTPTQKKLLADSIRDDGPWAPIVDELNARLHEAPQVGNQV
ncbi:DUF2789 family protein [Pseudomonas sp. HR96]|uniref:DUF2789 family protein n=1 Tax=Pseudomonas sp. HR96 TaxID=1027966 RepID=UPI002A7589C6|nr:DUF2789 family protein [Pseudomonas sp. HR96]WPP01876.1 DUF2789 family protein [Pseudomonas sp. HR96]